MIHLNKPSFQISRLHIIVINFLLMPLVPLELKFRYHIKSFCAGLKISQLLQNFLVIIPGLSHDRNGKIWVRKVCLLVKIVLNIKVISEECLDHVIIVLLTGSQHSFIVLSKTFENVVVYYLCNFLRKCSQFFVEFLHPKHVSFQSICILCFHKMTQNLLKESP